MEERLEQLQAERPDEDARPVGLAEPGSDDLLLRGLLHFLLKHWREHHAGAAD